MTKKTHITISTTDRDRLLQLINSVRLDRRVPMQQILALEGELARAKAVAPDQLPRDVISMNSTVWFRDVDTGELERFVLVYPHEADITQDRISVLAPVGTALLGYQVHDVIEWPVPQGKRRFQIVNVAQPAAACQAGAEELLAS
jgi:regulator of nucleoside diphosphate kinase